MGIETGVDLFKLMDVAEEIIVPMMEHVVRVDRESLTLASPACIPPSCSTPSARPTVSACQPGTSWWSWAARR
jgi:4-hydroxy-2-oxovalerate/4-hydroxy-2-oxohexanoate aldolase